jgi:hypothetical protein
MISATTTSVPFLSLTRSVLPQERTPDQDALVGSASLALTDLEKQCIDEFSDPKKEYKNYVKSLPEDREEEMRQSMDLAIEKGSKKTAWKQAGCGAVTGAVSGTVLSTIALVGGPVAFGFTVLGVAPVFGGIMAYGCYKTGLERGAVAAENARIFTVTNTRECAEWIRQRCHKIALPALLQFMPADRRERIDLDCPITRDWMQDPVEAADHRVYERSEIVRSLQIQGVSPFTREPMYAGELISRPDYYKDTFTEMHQNYNARVSQRESVVAAWERREPGTELSEFHVEGVAPEETAQILRFHNMGERRLKTTAHALSTEVLGRDGVADEVADAVTDFLTKTATKAPARV